MSVPVDSLFILFVNSCRKEEERIRQLNSRYAPAPPEITQKASPQRYRPPRSDQSTRQTRPDLSRDNDTSNYTDGNRRGRRSRSPTPERSPEVALHSSPVDTSPRGPLGIPRRHMTMAERKRIEWERERSKP